MRFGNYLIEGASSIFLYPIVVVHILLIVCTFLTTILCYQYTKNENVIWTYGIEWRRSVFNIFKNLLLCWLFMYLE